MPNVAEDCQDSTFTQIGVRNCNVQGRLSRYPASEDFPLGRPPPVRLWRLNSVALSTRFNVSTFGGLKIAETVSLYFVASEEKLLVFSPQNVRNNIPACPEITIVLPQTREASTLHQPIDPNEPHCINHVKVGNLGNFEVIVLALDDGDIVAYYTHTIEYVVRQVANKQAEPAVIRPFLHENVHSSAWGLALHQQSRLIAVGSNRHEITIFALRCRKPPEDGTENNISQPNSVQSISNTEVPPESADSSYGPLWVIYDRFIQPPCLANTRVEKRLPPDGHNIPSLDFTSDEEGNVSTVLAADINGNLWQFNPFTSEISHLPDMIAEIDDEGSHAMAWGVVVIPRKMFIDCKTPCEALGTDALSEAWTPFSKLKIFPSCFNATPYFSKDWLCLKQHSSLGDQCLSLWDNESCLKLEEDDKSDDPDAQFAVHVETIHRQLFEAAQLASPVLDMIRNDIMCFISRNLKLIVEESPPRTIPQTELVSLIASTRSVSEDYAMLLNYLRYYLSLNPALRRSDRRHLQWDYISQFKDDPEKKYVGVFENPSKYHLPRISDTVQKGKLDAQQALPITANGSAILMMYRGDMLFIPPHPFAMPQTICRNVMLPYPDQPGGDFERLCFQALIPPLKVLVVAGQRGQAVVLAATRMPPCMSSMAEVVTFRVEVELPLRHQLGDRTQAPLLGLAASPVWAGGAGRKDGVVSPAWRLILHYADHTILSYELYRDNGDELVVV